MGTDYAEKEREFIDSLADDTGRDLDQWMQAISAAGHAQRNDIIDWLRQQGFAFPKASWLERIHHNGGRLIYGGAAAVAAHARRQSPAQQSETVSAAASASHAPTKTDADVPVSRAAALAERQSEVHVRGSSTGEVQLFLGAAKGLKPLAEFTLREIEAAVPGISYFVAAPYLTIAAPAAFAALHPAPKELRLYADFGAASGERVRKAETTAARGTPPFPNMLILNDARQIDDAFRELVASAYIRALK